MWGGLSRTRLDCAVKIISSIDIIWGIYVVLWLGEHLVASDALLQKMRIDDSEHFHTGALCSRSLIVCVLILLIMFTLFYIKISVDLKVATTKRWPPESFVTWLWTAKFILVILTVTFVILVSYTDPGSSRTTIYWIILIVYRLVAYFIVQAFTYEVRMKVVGHLFEDVIETYWEFQILKLSLTLETFMLKLDCLILVARLKWIILRRKWLMLELFLYVAVIIPYRQRIMIWSRRIAPAFLVY